LPYNSVADSIHTRNFVTDCLQAKCNFTRQTAVLRFRDPLWGLSGNARCSCKAHWKARSRLPTSVNWTFFARCYSWGATNKNKLKIGEFAQTGSVWPNISDKKGRSTNHSYCHKTMINVLSCGIRMSHSFSFV